MRAALAFLALAAPVLAADSTPFARSGDPIVIPVTTTPRQFAVNQPNGTQSYRLANPCSVDIRLKTVPDMNTSITATTGTRFLARMVETLASVPPLSNPRVLSVMAMADPGPAGCSVEMIYGNGQ